MIDIPKRCHKHIRYRDETVRLRGYDGPIRQIAVTGLGRDNPTLFLSNNLRRPARELSSAMPAATGSRTAWGSA